ncbi:helix-turn-helix domain-containing protein [Photobacterium sp. 53610]|uniref:helix-turn-helix domain-containing protein n=1 Tax=Photobacterium sp. 53610 TaxID=3102789 RepID=UPI002ED93ADF
MAETVLIDGKKLKELREKHALSQEGLEHACSQKKGCSVSIATIKRAELGSSLSKRTVARLAKFFSISIEELLNTTSLDAEAEKIPCLQKVALTLWVRAGSKMILNEILDRISYLSPLIAERFGNTLVVVLPCVHDEKKLYLALQQVLFNLSHRVTPYFRAIISTQILSQQFDDPWRLDEASIHEMSELALQLEEATILVSDSLVEASDQCFVYGDQALLAGYKTLVKRNCASFRETQGRSHEIELFRYAIDRVKRQRENCLLAIQGVQGIGKSHMLNVFADMVETQGWRTVRLDFHLASAPNELLLTALHELLSDSEGGMTDQHENEDAFNKRIERLARSLGQIGSVFLSVDNFHLIDETTLATLLRIITKSESQTLLIGAAFLPTRVANHRIEAFSTVRIPAINMTLMPLTRGEMAQLPVGAFDVTPEAMASNLDRAEGNPSYFYQLLMSHAQNKIPTEVVLYLESKIDALPSELNRVMSFIVLMNDNLTLADFNTVASPHPGVIETLLEMKLIRLSSESMIRVNHPFLKDVIQQKMSHQEKRTIYLSMANYLASGASAASQETQRQLIDYYTKAEVWQKASQALLSLGRQCIESGDYHSAKQYLHTALESHQRLSDPELWLDLLFEIYLTQATIARVTNGWVSHSTVVAYQQCIALAKQLRCAFRHCISLSGLWVRQLMAMDFELSENTANEMLSLAEQSNDDSCKSLAHSCLANTQFWLAKHQDAIRNAKASFKYFQTIENQDVYLSIGINPLALAGCFGGLSATLACRDDDVRFFQSRQHEISFLNEPFSYAIVLQGEMWSAYHQKDLLKVISLSDQLLTIADSNNFPFYRGIASLFKGWALFFTTTLNEESSLTLVEEGYNHWLASSGDQIAHSLYSLMKAEIYCDVGRIDEAQRILEYGIEIALQKNEACYLSPMYALLAYMKEDRADYIKLAREIAVEQGAHLFLNQLE